LTLTVVLALVSLTGVLVFRGGGKPGANASKGVRVPIRSRGGRTLAGLAAWACMAVLLLPHFIIAWLSFIDHKSWQTELLPHAWTLDNYALLFSSGQKLVPFRNSLWMSALAAVAVAAISIPAAYLIGRRRPGHRMLNLVVMLPWALPGTVIAMNLIVAFNDPWLPLYNTVWLLPLAYFVRNVPLLTRMAAAAFEPFDASLLEAGRSLGASRTHCLVHVAFPLLAPALLASTALVFALCLGEFVSSILLYTMSNIPISVQIAMEWRESVGAAFAHSVLLMALVGATFALARRFSSRS
jgi:iron(III) transport system permease protein